LCLANNRVFWQTGEKMEKLKIEMISIPMKTYDQLIKDQKWRQALEAAGVNNWEGYELALESISD